MIHTNKALGFALTPSYLAKVSFLQKTRDKVHLMVDSIKSAFATRVSHLDWIDDTATKKAIGGKITAAKPLIGFPAFANDTKALDKMYHALNITPDNFVQNTVKLA